ncbi:MAG: flagellar biosynthesis protein FlhF [Bradymonadia bacterium]
MESTHNFRGRTMSEAVARLKASLGPEAVIIQTRRGRDTDGTFVEITARGPQEPAMAGPGSGAAAYRRMEKVTAPAATPRRQPGREAARTSDQSIGLAKAREMAARIAPEVSARNPELARRLEALKGGAPTGVPGPLSRAAGITEAAAAPQPTAQHAPSRNVAAVSSGETDRLKALVDVFASKVEAFEARLAEQEGGTVKRLAHMLNEVGISRAHAEALARRASERCPGCTPEDGALLAALGREMADSMPVSGDLLPAPGARRVLAFVGPTGVGKTTTIAKIAARAALMEGRTVALITVDTFRMAAVEQLASYARILECPLRIARDAGELKAALEAFSDRDLVLVDTTGRSPRDTEHVSALGGFFPEGWGGSLVLTVSSSTRERDMFAAVDAYGQLGVETLCVTKLDETDAPGAVYSAVRRAGRPLAWVTTGQRVPEDLEQAEAAPLSARIVARASTLRQAA